MGTERFEVYRGSCHCGLGQFIITHCSPNHPWAGANPGWYDISISCDNCRSKFELVEQRGYIVLVNKTDIKDKEVLLLEVRNRSKELMARSEVQKLIKKFKALLSVQRSIAACYRFLNENNFVSDSISTFRKNWGEVDDWVNTYIGVYDLEKLMVLLDERDPIISREINEIRSIYQNSEKPLPYVGDPIYKKI
jgi:hypothetical protein